MIDFFEIDSEWRNWKESGGSQPKIGNKKIDVDVYGAANKGSDPTALKLYALNITFFFEHDLHPGKKLNLDLTK